MEKVLVIGSGSSGVHFALSLLKKKYQVIMVDVGYEKPAAVKPDNTFQELKTELSDPVRYFLGDKFEAVVIPGAGENYLTKYYGFPPSKNHVFSQPTSFKYEAQGFEPLISFARGGLAEAWTGGAYPYNEAELEEFPFTYRDIEPHYSEVARRIGLFGSRDDLARFFPYHDNLMEPLRLDEHSQLLFNDYDKIKLRLNQKYHCYLGRSRVTTISRDIEGRRGCTYCGRCLWGCPGESLYTPSITLRECHKYPNFTYIPYVYVSRFKTHAGRITHIVAKTPDGLDERLITADRFVLAAGTLSSSKIILETILHEEGELIKLDGLMDNRQILVPFVNMHFIGKRYNPNNYQYHQVAVGIETLRPEEYVHGQITTLKTALAHPVIQNLPFDLRTSSMIFRNVRAGLGVVNLNMHDRRRNSNYVTLKLDPVNGRSSLVIHYQTEPDHFEKINQIVKTMKGFLIELKCIVPPGMVQIRPMGASVHYSGTLPMTLQKRSRTVTEYCQSNDYENLFIVDGTTMPFLPAKNITFTLMANAVRVAEAAF